MISLSTFLENVKKIADKRPEYRHGADGSNGYCDCIGLIIGAIRRSGGTWKGIHGSNYAIRNEMQDGFYDFVSDPSQLSLGDIVFKGRDRSDGGYDLPSRYMPGGSMYNGDVIDYYHVGVVTSTNPFEITHMTSPTIKVDTKLGRWAFRGRAKKIDYGNSANDAINENENTDNGGIELMEPISKAEVVDVRGYLNIRAGIKTDSTDIGDIPIGSIIFIYEKAHTGMWKTSYNGTVGYVNSKYLKEIPLEEQEANDGDNQYYGTGVFIPMDYDTANAFIEALKGAKVLS